MVTDTQSQNNIGLEKVRIGDENFYKISNSNRMRPFFMSVVSASNHWMFISSNGGLTAGRKNSDYALFPYYTDDKITESAEITGSKSIFQIKRNGQILLWEPFSIRNEGKYHIQRNLYKNIHGNKIIFEEVNNDLELVFRYEWNSSDVYGFVKKSTLHNNGPGQVQIIVLDGIQNILPYGVGSDTQNQSSNLVDAYKRSEIDRESGVGVFALSAIIVDKAEPSEALKANIVWSSRLNQPKYLLSSIQLDAFRKGGVIESETDIKGEKGAYFINTEVNLQGGSSENWMLVANVNQSRSAVAKIIDNVLNDPHLPEKVEQDIDLCAKNLLALNVASDGLQLTADHLRDSRHFSNTLFNIMRGGIFDNNYQIEKEDFLIYLKNANKSAFEAEQEILAELTPEFPLSRLKKLAENSENVHFTRLSYEYLPLKFSRRHGDPSRPWNKFSINTHNDLDGSKILDYEGNWRDIFQNWEALSYSYPAFIEGMIQKFLNATTFDGYNPYRVTKGGFDWETIEPDNPWSYIGYWGDHQIIYLLKFLEFIEKYDPGKLKGYFDKELFVYANVPYRIKPYEAIVSNPKDTIEFDEHLDQAIRERRSEIGADGALLLNKLKEIHRVNFIEKMLATVLAKMSNFIPEGGIWMNTQRPEWNDANNALVGNGVSMVTLYYLRRFLKYLETLLSKEDENSVLQISEELITFFDGIYGTLKKFQYILEEGIDDVKRKLVLDGLGIAGSEYREKIYHSGYSGKKRGISFDELKSFIDISLIYLEQSIQANRREDNLYHAYNLMTVKNEKEVSISYLSEMLEGQVAVLSSGYLSSSEVVMVLDALKNSALFRNDQYSYLLYPNKELPLFLERNDIDPSSVESSLLLSSMVEKGEEHIIEKDVNGKYHFNGNFKNAADVALALDSEALSKYGDLVEKEREKILQIFEDVFNHKAFTGRSGTFFGYEGLGSIYWHMVSKLQLAVQECCHWAYMEKADAETFGRLLEHYYEINAGIGVHKSPALYGAFPTDPYSHTPAGKGAQQPGMTGQVKEDILSRFGELGISIQDGIISFDPYLLRRDEFLSKPASFNYIDISGNDKIIPVEKGSLAFTFCQIPVIYKISNVNSLKVLLDNGQTENLPSTSLNKEISKNIFERTGEVQRILVELADGKLK